MPSSNFHAIWQQLMQESEQLDFRLKLEDQSKQLVDYQNQISKPEFWQNPEAKNIQKKYATLGHLLQPWLSLRKSLDNYKQTLDLIDDIEHKDLISDFKELEQQARKQLRILREQLHFNYPYADCSSVILSFLAGAGGTDAQDWTRMLFRMYSRWAESQKLKQTVISQSAGDEAGFKSLSFKLESKPFLHGLLKGEHGVHRLIRLSPFNSKNLRQTSFAKVEVLPVLESTQQVNLKDSDLRIDTYRSSGPGGQGVNKTDSAVRVTHLPTELHVTIQNTRSQNQNKQLALDILKSKLLKLQADQQAEDLANLKKEDLANEWGSQIRNYVLHPYKQIKDLRTQYSTSEVEKVLDGQLDDFLQAYLDYTAKISYNE